MINKPPELLREVRTASETAIEDLNKEAAAVYRRLRDATPSGWEARAAFPFYPGLEWIGEWQGMRIEIVAEPNDANRLAWVIRIWAHETLARPDEAIITDAIEQATDELAHIAAQKVLKRAAELLKDAWIP